MKEKFIINVTGPFGFRREGDGIFVYLYSGELDEDAVKQVVEYGYKTFENIVENEDGEDDYDWSEYDPSILRSDIVGELEDEVTFEEIAEEISGKGSKEKKFSEFIKEVFDRNIPIIYIDTVRKEINQIDTLENAFAIINNLKSKLSIFIREYDHMDDY
jgi:hypothetical protein